MSKRKSLQGFWLSWQRCRYHALLAEPGLREIAYSFAKHEAIARRDLARIVGRAMAIRALLGWHDANGKFSVTLQLPEDFYPTESQRLRLWKRGAKNLIVV